MLSDTALSPASRSRSHRVLRGLCDYCVSGPFVIAWLATDMHTVIVANFAGTMNAVVIANFS